MKSQFSEKLIELCSFGVKKDYRGHTYKTALRNYESKYWWIEFNEIPKDSWVFWYFIDLAIEKLAKDPFFSEKLPHYNLENRWRYILVTAAICREKYSVK